MVFGYSKPMHEAVMFIDGDRITKEMLFAEFEAVLDNIVGVPEFADGEKTAVYLKIDKQLRIHGAVFFKISFDAQGHADARWNVPLEHLIDTGSRGPDLGAGPVRMACRSQCQVPWHQQNLWEPSLAPQSNILKLLAATVKSNRLGLDVEVDAEPPVLGDKVANSSSPAAAQIVSSSSREQSSSFQVESTPTADDEERLTMARNIKKQRMYIANLKTRHQEEIERVQKMHMERIDFVSSELIQTRKRLESLDSAHCRALLELEQSKMELEKRQSSLDKQVSEAAAKQGIDLNAIDQKYRAEFEDKIQSATSELQEQLDMKDAELTYRTEEINRLKKENAELQSSSDKQDVKDAAVFLKQLSQTGMEFVACMPGLEPINVPVNDLGRYMKSPAHYIAARAGIDERQFVAWHEHQDLPVCSAKASGKLCGKLLQKVDDPTQFIAGVSDRCADHVEQADLLKLGT